MKRSISFFKFACRIFSRRVSIFRISWFSAEGVLEVSGGEGAAAIEMGELSPLVLDSPDSISVVAGWVEEEEVGRVWLMARLEMSVLGSGSFLIKLE